MIGIYCIKNQKTDWNYIGSSVSIFNRWKQHSKELNEGKHHCHRLQCAWDSDGATNFTFSILEICGEEILLQKEQEWIDKLYNNGCIYNTKVKVIDNSINKKYKSNKIIKCKTDNNGVYFPYGLSYNLKSIRSEKLLLLFFNKNKQLKEKYTEMTLKEIMSAYYMDNGVFFNDINKYILDMKSVKINNNYLFANIEYEDGVFIFNINKVPNAKYYNSNINIKDILGFKSKETLRLFTYIMSNNGKAEIEINDIAIMVGKSLNTNHLQKNIYQRTICPMIKDLERVKVNISIQAIKKAKKIVMYKFELK